MTDSPRSQKLDVTGMTCDHCVRAVRQALAAVPGVSRVVQVDRERGAAIVEGDAAVEALIAAVVDEGYQASA